MLVRYRSRIDPTPGQRRALARTFGCARVVYNDSLRERERAHAATEQLSDAEVQRRVITLAKRTPERAWLAEVASVALVQACQDARRAYRDWFDSRSGARKGRRVGHPSCRAKHGRQSIRLTRNGFSVRQGGRPYVAKLGELRVRWSRALPSVPSSVTIIRDPDGRYYASLVVERPAIPLPPVDRVAGIDLGLCAFAAVAASDASTETVPNQRHLRAAERRLARAQRQLSRKRKGSANRAKARRRVAVAHRRVRDRRADHHHKLALRLLRENHAVAVKISPWRGWPGRGWREASTTPAGRCSSGCWRRRPPTTVAGSSGSAGSSRPRRPARCAGTGTAPSRSTCASGHAARAGPPTTAT
jgi:putative transposase